MTLNSFWLYPHLLIYLDLLISGVKGKSKNACSSLQTESLRELNMYFLFLQGRASRTQVWVPPRKCKFKRSTGEPIWWKSEEEKLPLSRDRLALSGLGRAKNTCEFLMDQCGLCTERRTCLDISQIPPMGVLKDAWKFISAPSFRRWSPMLILLNMDWTWWLAPTKLNVAEVTLHISHS